MAKERIETIMQKYKTGFQFIKGLAWAVPSGGPFSA